jgi:uncharacterized membrane-anchored protein
LGLLPRHELGALTRRRADDLDVDVKIEYELSESWRAASRVAIGGPRTADLGTQGRLQVPPKMAFVPVPEASRILRALGNTARPDLIGLVASTNESETWLATITFRDEGYIRDDDAKVWNADELLASLKEGTEQSNKDRRTRGFPELEIPQARSE